MIIRGILYNLSLIEEYDIETVEDMLDSFDRFCFVVIQFYQKIHRGSFYIQLFKFILQLTTAIGLTVVIYLAAYVLFFLGYFVLILRKGDMKREFHIPGGRAVKLVVAAVGLFMTVVTLIISFFPSSKLTDADNRVYQIVLIVCFIVSMAAPLIIYSNRHRWSSSGKATSDEK